MWMLALMGVGCGGGAGVGVGAGDDDDDDDDGSTMCDPAGVAEVCLCPGPLGRLLVFTCPADNPTGIIAYDLHCEIGEHDAPDANGFLARACLIRFVSSDPNLLAIRTPAGTDSAFVFEDDQPGRVILDTIAPNGEGTVTISVFEEPGSRSLGSFDVAISDSCRCTI